jgi:hypothetical protein
LIAPTSAQVPGPISPGTARAARSSSGSRPPIIIGVPSITIPRASQAASSVSSPGATQTHQACTGAKNAASSSSGTSAGSS